MEKSGNEKLLTCFGSEPPRRLLLLTHPELWQDGTIGDRMQYLDQVLLETAVREKKEYFDKYVRTVWLNHPAPQQHDERERQQSSTDSSPTNTADLPGGKI